MKRHTFARYVLSAGVAPLAIIGAAAQAQDQPATPEPSAVGQDSPTATTSDSASVPDIIVTANRQAQDLQKVSSAVQVIDGAKLRSQALVNVSQIFQNVPSVQITAQPAGFNVDIRGQGGDLPAGTTQGSVALEFDGVYNIQSQAATIGFFDVDRIEVLPGPQSTRYGPNADGGIVNVITRDPVLGSSAGDAALTVGNYGLVRAEIAQNIPITDTLAMRVVGAAIHRNSYFEPKASNAIGQSVRVKLLFQPTDRFSLKAEYQFDHIGGTGQGSEPYSIGHVAPYSGDSINDFSNPWDHGDYSDGCSTTTGTDNVGDCGPAENRANIHQHTFLGVLSYQFNNWAALDVSTSYIKETGVQRSCYGVQGPPWQLGGPHGCFTTHNFAPFNEFATEARLHNADGSRLLWNLGFYHWNYHFSSNSTASPGIPAASATATNAVFGDVTFPVTERFRLIAGARESWDKRSSTQSRSGVQASANFNRFDYRAGQEYDLTPTSMEYFTVSTGYRPGGITFNGTDPVTFKSEANTAFELGVKNRFFDNMLQINGDVFYYRQKNYQFLDNYQGRIVTLADGGTSNCVSVGGLPLPPECATPTFGLQAHALGVETQIRFNPTRDDTFSFTGTLLDAKFNKKQGACAPIPANPPAGVVPGVCYGFYNDQSAPPPPTPLAFPLAGAVQPHSPNFAGTFSYAHTFRLASGATFSLGGDAFYSGGYWVHPVQDAKSLGYQPSYWLGNLQATFTPSSSHWTVSAFVRNVSNYAVKQATLPITTIGDPRTFGATLGLKW